MEEKGDSLELVETRDAINLVPRWEIQGWWFFAAAAIIVAIVTVVILLRRKKFVHDPFKDKRQAYATAKKALAEIGDSGARQKAGKVSLALRGYLAKCMGDPALFETHEEFIGRHESLTGLPDDTRESVSLFFGKLAEMKYGAEENVSLEHGELVSESTELLERIHQS